jgi:hypothetical protein
MTAPPGPVWGFCETCERWRLSAAWGDPPSCPECGTPPRPLESWADGTGQVTLILELPPGGSFPLLE